VILQLFTVGSLPIISLALASSFAIYGLLRKKMHVDSFVGLLIESLLMLPVAIIYWLYFVESSTANLAVNSNTLNITLVMAGVVTTAPLLCFTAAAKRLTLSSLGFFQYIGPSIMFILAFFYYQESMQMAEFATFIFIWSALALYSFDAYNTLKKTKLIRRNQ
jgi:chloramphenicol-sensitive protein RarD